MNAAKAEPPAALFIAADSFWNAPSKPRIEHLVQ